MSFRLKNLQTEAVRILLLNQVFYPDPQASSQYLSRLADELAQLGHQVTVLTARRDYDNPTRQYPPRETWRDVEIIRVWNTGWGHGSKMGLAVDYLTFLMAALLRGLLLKRVDEVVALTSPPLVSVVGAILAGIWRARFVYWLMDMNPDEAIAVGWLRAGSFLARMLEMASRWSLRQADKIIVLDRYMAGARPLGQIFCSLCGQSYAVSSAGYARRGGKAFTGRAPDLLWFCRIRYRLESAAGAGPD
jgi:colanic acid biosynthesis glycosyl transferase WcaI